MSKITGIEVDGSHVRVIRVNGSNIASFDEIDGETPADALAAAAKKFGKPGAKTVVVWSGRTLIRPADLPVSADTILPTVIRDVAPTVMPIHGMVLSGVVSGEPDGRTRPGMIGAADIRDLEPVYKAFGSNVRLMLSAFSFSDDGIYLAVRSSGVEMSQVDGGYLNAARTLDVEGIDELRSSFAAAGADTVQLLEDYGDRVVAQVRETIRQWARDQRTSSTTNVLYVHGIGSDVPGLREKLQSETARQVLEPPVPGVSLSTVNGREGRAIQALFAATSNAQNLPGVWLLDPVDEQAKVAKKAKERQQRNILAAGGVAAAVLLFLGWPIYSAKNGLDDAKSNYQNRSGEFAQLADADVLGFQHQALSQQIFDIESTEPTWSAVLSFILDNLPAGVQITEMQAAVDGGELTVIAKIEDTSAQEAFVSPEEWASNLIRDLEIPYAFPRNLAVSDQGVSGEFSIPIPNDVRFFEHSENPDPTLEEDEQFDENGNPIDPNAPESDDTTQPDTPEQADGES